MFYDRVSEQKRIINQLDKIKNGESISIVIEGKQGVGKTDLMRQCMKEYKKYAFRYTSSDYIYKCNESDSTIDFLFISDVLCALQEKNNSKFTHELTDFLDKTQLTSVRETIARAIQEIPGGSRLKSVIDPSLDAISTSKSQVEDITYNKRLVLCFAHIIGKMLTGEKVVFCIDDIVWMDEFSYNTLKSVLIQNRNNISLFITTRRRTDLDKKFYNRISDLTDLINGAYPEINCLNEVIHDFDFDTFCTILKKHQRDVFNSNLKLLHEITKGNPLEINNFIKESDTEILERINDYKGNKHLTNEEYSFTTERNVYYLNINYYNASILSALSIYGLSLDDALLQQLSKTLVKNIYKYSFSYTDYINSIQKLADSEIIKSEKSISFCHDSSQKIILEYLKTNGDFTRMASTIADSLRLNNTLDTAIICSILRLYSESEPQKGVSYYIDLDFGLQKKNDIVKLASICFINDFGSISDSEMESYCVDIFMPSLFQSASLQEAYNLGVVLVRRLNGLTLKGKQKFLSIFIKILVELGRFEGELSANELFSELCSMIDENDTSGKLEIYLTGMMVFEHQGRFDEIKQCFSKIRKMEIDDTISYSLLSRLYRATGLVYFHADLKDNYNKAIDYAKNVDNDVERFLLLGSCYNNRGLTSFYSGKIDEAKEFFDKARKQLWETEYETLRPLNNLACCEMALGNLDDAYHLLVEALSQPFCGVFEMASADLNRALVLFWQGDVEGATQILKKYTDEYEQGTPKLDGWIYSNAFLNQGYIALMSGDYEYADRLYEKSTFYKSRFRPGAENERRLQFAKTSRERQQPKLPVGNFDFFDTPYILSLLAYYII